MVNSDQGTKRQAAPFRFIPPQPVIDLGTVEPGEAPADRPVVLEVLDAHGGKVETDASWLEITPPLLELGIRALRLRVNPKGLPAGEHEATVRVSAGTYHQDIKVR
ncbi:MAG: hypothetical protein ACYCW6_04070, partial [Candidatus Xenobia bacterium]